MQQLCILFTLHYSIAIRYDECQVLLFTFYVHYQCTYLIIYSLCYADIPDTGLLCDLLWADPDKDIVGWGENDRGVSFTFGEDVVAQFLRRHDLDLICRAHQVSSRVDMGWWY